MPVQFDKFDQSKVDNLKNHLVSMAQKGKAKFYEIFVDSLKAVPKTDEPSEFEGYEDYMSPETAQLKIVIYNSAASPRNDQYVFLFKAQSREEAMDIGLNGMPIKTFSYNDIGEWRKKNERKTAEQIQIQALKKEIAELNDIIDEKEEQIEKLSGFVMEAKQNGNKLGGIHLGDIVSVALEGIVKRNSHVLEKVTGFDGLAGLLEKGNNTPQIATPESEVTFKKKDQPNNNETRTETSPINDEDKKLLAFFNQLRMHFSGIEMEKVFSIIHLLSQNKEEIESVLDFLKDNSTDGNNEEEEEETEEKEKGDSQLKINPDHENEEGEEKENNLM